MALMEEDLKTDCIRPLDAGTFKHQKKGAAQDIRAAKRKETALFKFGSKKIKHVSEALLIMAAIFVMCTNVSGKLLLDAEGTEIYLDAIAEYEMGTVTEPAYGYTGGEWLILAIGRYKPDDEYISIYIENVRDTVESCGGVLSTKKYTEYARVSIGLTAAGENPENFAGYNLLSPLVQLDDLKNQGYNAVLYALLALDSGDYTLPDSDEDYTGETATRKKLLKLILDSQLSDGGWNILGSKGDVDTTAMTLQALARYYIEGGTYESEVSEAVSLGLDFLSSSQQEDGGYLSGTTANCESTAQVLCALSELGMSIDDKDFIKNGNTILDGLWQYYSAGGFVHTAGGTVNQMATEQAFYSLVAYYRNITGQSPLYNMTDSIKRTAVTYDESEVSSVSENSDGTVSISSGSSGEKITKKKSTKKKSSKGSESKKTEESTEESDKETKKTEEITSESGKNTETQNDVDNSADGNNVEGESENTEFQSEGSGVEASEDEESTGETADNIFAACVIACWIWMMISEKRKKG